MNRLQFPIFSIRTGAMAFALTALPLVFAARPASAQLLFVAGNGGQFGQLNAATGAYNYTANTTFNGTNTVLAGLGVGTDGFVYGVDTAANSLYRINTANATLSRVGLLGFPTLGTGENYSLGFTSTANGTLYAYFGRQTVNSRINSLYTVNQTTGAASLVNTTGQSFDGGFSDDGNNNLFSNGGGTGTFPNSLLSINRTLGTATPVGSADARYGITSALGFSGSLYGFTEGSSGTGTIYTIAPATGVITPTATYDASRAGTLFGATRFVTTSAPEPGTLSLLGMGLAGGLGVVARRRKKSAK